MVSLLSRLQMAGMPRIDQDRYLSADGIGATIVVIGILPKIGIKILSSFIIYPLIGRKNYKRRQRRIQG